MLDKIKIFDFGTVAITGIILFFLIFMGWIIAGQILRPMFFPTAKEAMDPAYAKTYRKVPTLIGLAILYGPFLAGFLWAWNKPALFMTEPDGEWNFRNSLYFSLLRIPPDQPRQVEVELSRQFYKGSNQRFFYTGFLHVLTPSQGSSAIRTTCDPQPDGTPDFFAKFGYGETTTFSKGPHDGQMTALHTWGASGPVFLAEQNISPPLSP